MEDVAVVTQSEMVDYISSVLRQAGNPVPKSTIRRCFPGRFNRALYGVYMNVAPDRTHNALVAISRRLPKNDQARSTGKVREVDKRLAHQGFGFLESRPLPIPEVGPDDCPHCGCKDAQLSLKCPNCEEVW